MRALAILGMLVLAAVACESQSVVLNAQGPISYPAPVDASLRRFIVGATVENRGSGQLVVSPASFQARDAGGRVFRADANAAAADAQQIRLVASRAGIGLGPLPTVSLQGGDRVSGLVVFEVPAGTRLTQLVFRADDHYYTIDLTPPAVDATTRPRAAP